MHNRKIIAKGFAIGITISSFSLNSMANTINEYKILKEEKIEYSSKDTLFENVIRNLFVKKPESKEVIEINKNIVRGSVLQITLADGQFVEDLSGNPGGYETVKVTTTGDKKLVESDYNNLRLSGISKIDLSDARSDSIPRGAFTNATHLTEFKFPKGITVISGANSSNGAFSGCTGLTGELIIPDTVVEIGGCAFYKCTSLVGKLVLPDSLKVIGNNAFSLSTGLTGDLIIPDSVTTLHTAVFRGCTGFNGKLVLPNSLKIIPTDIFSGCTNLTGELVIPDSVTTISATAFNGCSGFNGNLKIGNSTTTIEASAFKGCSGLTGDLVIPKNVQSIASNAFQNCSGFNGSLEIPEGVTYIGANAFANCSGLAGNLIIPDSVTSVGSYSFAYCSGFTGLKLGKNLETINSFAFSSCSGFKGSLILPDKLKTIDNSSFSGCNGFTGSLVIPESVTTIGTRAFLNCSGFDGELKILGNVQNIQGLTFQGCSKLTGELVIPDSVSIIDTGAFSSCVKLTGLKLGSNVTHIKNNAFNGCSGIKGDLVIPNSVIEIGDTAFNSCSGIESLTLSNSLTSLGQRAFYGCRNITGDIYIPNGITSIGNEAFLNSNNIGRFIVRVGKEDSVSDYRQSIIEKLMVGKTKIEASYDMDFTGTWIETSGIEIIQPTIKSMIDGVEGEVVDENNESVVLNIPMEFLEEQSTISIDGKEFSFPKANSDGKYVFTDEGDYELAVKTKLGTIYNLEFGVRTKEMQEAEDLVTEIIDTTPTVYRLEEIRKKVNALPESFRKEELQRVLNSISIDLELEKKNTTANLDIYIKSENMLSLSIDTNSVTFENYSGTEDMIKSEAINLTVNSSLPYKVNAYLESNIENSDGSSSIDMSLLNIKASSDSDFKEFTSTKTPVILLDDQPKGNGAIHDIDLKLKGSLAHKADVYKTTIKLEVIQK